MPQIYAYGGGHDVGIAAIGQPGPDVSPRSPLLPLPLPPMWAPHAACAHAAPADGPAGYPPGNIPSIDTFADAPPPRWSQLSMPQGPHGVRLQLAAGRLRRTGLARQPVGIIGLALAARPRAGGEHAARSRRAAHS